MESLGRALEPAVSSVHLRLPSELRGLVGRRQQSPSSPELPTWDKTRENEEDGRKGRAYRKAEKEGRETQKIRRVSRIGGVEKSRERGGYGQQEVSSG